MSTPAPAPHVQTSLAPSTSQIASARSEYLPDLVKVEDPTGSPITEIKPESLRAFGQKLDQLFRSYVSDRRIAELRWLRNERQYLGVYDPETEKELSTNRSKAYPRVTRVKCISVLSRLMSLMFPGNERNWEIKASPNPAMKPEDVMQAVQDAQKADQAAGVQSPVDDAYVHAAVQTMANDRAEQLSVLIDDQLQELGGHQTSDYVALNRKVLQSGVIYGLGVLQGPYVRSVEKTEWAVGKDNKATAKVRKVYMPMFEFRKIWDFYPDMSAKSFAEMDGYFTREVMSRAQVRKLADREDFMAAQIKLYLKNHQMGNYRPQPFETELRAMGVKVNVNEMKTETSKYEVIVWHGQTSGAFLLMAGVPVADDKLADDVDAEIWMIDGNVVKATLNPWKELGVDVKTLHTFLFDEDDTSPVGFGLPNAIRDSQMAISAATRMLLDNASVVCGPQLEVNTDLLRADQDLASTAAYKIWYREGTGADAQFPAVRNVEVDAHLADLQKIIEMFLKFADMETFVGPATGGDMENMNSEPMRTAAGASMLRGDAALPFKDIVRSFDSFTQSVLDSLVQFNRKFNPDLSPEGDYNVIARGATSLIAKEVRGMQIDQLVQTLTPAEALHVDDRKLAEARFAVRDMTDLLVSKEEAARRKSQQDATTAQQTQQTQQQVEAEIRKVLSEAFKNIAQGQKNAAAADADTVDTMLTVMERGATAALGGLSGQQQTEGPPGANPGGPVQPSPDAGDSAGGGMPPAPSGEDQAGIGGGLA